MPYGFANALVEKRLLFPVQASAEEPPTVVAVCNPRYVAIE
jgi:hypothetical protein